MALVVDGMNVIGSRPDGWWRDRIGAMRRLVEALRMLDDDVTVVLDGGPRDIGDTGDVTVVWAPGPGPDAADRVIADLVEAAADPSQLRVVTSDRALAAEVLGLGGSVVGAGEFRRGLEQGS